MLNRNRLDPVAHERFERVWPAADPAADPDLDAGSILDPVLRPGRDVGSASEEYEPVQRAWSAPDAPAGGADQHAGLISRPVGALPRPSALGALSPGRRAVKALAAVGLVVVVIAAFVAWRSQPRAEAVAPAGSNLMTSSVTATVRSAPAVEPSVVPEAAPAASGSSSAGMIVVAVTGRVRHPGLVYLLPGARVADAIAAAGGVLPRTDLSFVNLARKVSDGELIVIGVQPSPGMTVDPTGAASAPASGAASDGPVDINSAGLAQLETLPGIGPALAQRILDYRTQHGGFRSVDELQDVSGIGPAKFAQIKDLVTT